MHVEVETLELPTLKNLRLCTCVCMHVCMCLCCVYVCRHVEVETLEQPQAKHGANDYISAQSLIFPLYVNPHMYFIHSYIYYCRVKLIKNFETNYTHMCIHTYIHTYIHTCMHILLQGSIDYVLLDNMGPEMLKEVTHTHTHTHTHNMGPEMLKEVTHTHIYIYIYI